MLGLNTEVINTVVGDSMIMETEVEVVREATCLPCTITISNNSRIVGTAIMRDKDGAMLWIELANTISSTTINSRCRARLSLIKETFLSNSNSSTSSTGNQLMMTSFNNNSQSPMVEIMPLTQMQANQGSHPCRNNNNNTSTSPSNLRLPEAKIRAS